MYHYLNEQLTNNRGVMKDSSFINIKTVVEKNHKRIRERFLTTSKVSSPTHILVKLIHGFEFFRNDTYDSIYDRAYKKQFTVGSSNRLTTISNYGKSFTNQFLQDATESLLLVVEDFNPNLPWTELEPIEYLYHSNTNVNFQIGKEDDSDTFALIKINYAMLAWQYLKWRLWTESTDAPQNLYHFLAKFPIYNSLKSYMDISLFNRHYYRVIGKTIPNEPKVREYPVPNLEDRINRSNLKIMEFLYNKELPLSNVIDTIPTFFCEDLFSRIKEPDTVSTMQLDWVHIAHCLPYIHLGLAISEDLGGNINKQVTSNIKRELNAFMRTRVTSKLSPDVRIWLEDLVEDVLILT